MTPLVGWITAFIDRPAATFDACSAFWAQATGATISPLRGDDHEFATLVPPGGDAYLRVQRTTDGSAGSHLDLHTSDVGDLVEAALALGAVRAAGDHVVDALELHARQKALLNLKPTPGWDLMQDESIGVEIIPAPPAMQTGCARAPFAVAGCVVEPISFRLRVLHLIQAPVDAVVWPCPGIHA